MLDRVFGHRILKLVQIIGDEFVAMDRDLRPALGLAVIRTNKTNHGEDPGLIHASLFKPLVLEGARVQSHGIDAR